MTTDNVSGFALMVSVMVSFALSFLALGSLALRDALAFWFARDNQTIEQTNRQSKAKQANNVTTSKPDRTN